MYVVCANTKKDGAQLTTLVVLLPTPPLQDETAMMFRTPDRPEGPSGPKSTVAGTVESPDVSRAERTDDDGEDVVGGVVLKDVLVLGGE